MVIGIIPLVELDTWQRNVGVAIHEMKTLSTNIEVSRQPKIVVSGVKITVKLHSTI